MSRVLKAPGRAFGKAWKKASKADAVAEKKRRARERQDAAIVKRQAQAATRKAERAAREAAKKARAAARVAEKRERAYWRAQTKKAERYYRKYGDPSEDWQ